MIHFYNSSINLKIIYQNNFKFTMVILEKLKFGGAKTVSSQCLFNILSILNKLKASHFSNVENCERMRNFVN